MLDLIIKLIDRCIDLAKRREQTNRNLFTDFVTPAFADFETLHKGYLETFRSYREMIKTADNFSELKDELLRKIEVDSLFSAAERAKIWELGQWANNSEIGPFIIAIIRYIRFDSRWNPRPSQYDPPATILDLQLDQQFIVAVFREVRDNALRSFLFDEIRSDLEQPIPKEFRRKAALESLDDTLSEMQYNYSQVVHEYFSLKSKLLKSL